MKILEILLSFFLNQGKSFVQTNTQALTSQLVNNVRKIAVLLSVTVIAIALFCVGVTMAYSAAVADMELGGAWQWSPKFMSGLALALVSLGGLIYGLGESRWLAATGAQAAAPAAAASNSALLQEALAVLVLEFANELKERRAKAASSAGAST